MDLFQRYKPSDSTSAINVKIPGIEYSLTGNTLFTNIFD
jgi:hypothetical protein